MTEQDPRITAIKAMVSLYAQSEVRPQFFWAKGAAWFSCHRCGWSGPATEGCECRSKEDL